MQFDALVLGKLEKASFMSASTYLSGSYFHVLPDLNNTVFYRVTHGDCYQDSREQLIAPLYRSLVTGLIQYQKYQCLHTSVYAHKIHNVRKTSQELEDLLVFYCLHILILKQWQVTIVFFFFLCAFYYYLLVQNIVFARIVTTTSGVKQRVLLTFCICGNGYPFHTRRQMYKQQMPSLFTF